MDFWWIQHQEEQRPRHLVPIGHLSAWRRKRRRSHADSTNGGWEKASPCVGRCRLARLGPETVFEPGQRMTVRWRDFRGYIPRSADSLSPWSIILTHTHLRSIWTLFLPCQKHTSCFLGQRLFLDVFSRAGIVRLCYTYCMEMHH